MTENEFSTAFSTAFDPSADPLPDADCGWPVDTACFTDEWDQLTPDVQVRALRLASATLHRLTGYRVGGCPVTIRPCKQSCATNYAIPYFRGVGMDPHVSAAGVWVNSCGCLTDCSGSELCEITLPGPVGEVFEIRLDGNVLDPTDYRVDGTKIVWTGGGDCPWPACQDMAAGLDQPGTFGIKYRNAYKVDAVGAYAAAVLAMEYAQACVGNKCRLPATVTSISRQGVSFDIPTGAFPNGFTGIREVDTYLGLWNPQALREQTKVWTPDLSSPRVVQ